jgi:hypothetical protein
MDTCTGLKGLCSSTEAHLSAASPCWRPSALDVVRVYVGAGGHKRYCVGPRSWRRPPHFPLSEAQTPTHRRKGACEDSGVMLSGHKWPTRWSKPCVAPEKLLDIEE